MSLLLLVDLDGVVYRGAEPVPGVAEVLAARAAAGDDVVYVTNNSMHYRADYVTRLSGMGAPVTPDTVVSSARATALYLAEQDPPIRRVLVLGAGGLEREARDVGLEVVTAAHAATRMQQEGIDGYAAAGEPDAVLVGLDPNLTYLRLAAAADCVRAGARFIATNRDPVYPTERGMRPGAGAIVAAVEATTGVTPISIGKPAPRLLEIAAHAVGRDPREAIMVGDGILTDLAAANALGARCVFMLTGRLDARAVPGARAGRPAGGRRRGRRRTRRRARGPGRRAGHRRRAGLTKHRGGPRRLAGMSRLRRRGLRRARRPRRRVRRRIRVHGAVGAAVGARSGRCRGSSPRARSTASHSPSSPTPRDLRRRRFERQRRSACNQYFGEFALVDGRVTLGGLGGTEMACAEPIMASRPPTLPAWPRLTRHEWMATSSS